MVALRGSSSGCALRLPWVGAVTARRPAPVWPGSLLPRVFESTVSATFPIKLVDRRLLAPTVGHYRFVRDDGLPLDFQPGQFIQIHFERADGSVSKRSYSLATRHDHALGPGEAVEIAVSFVPGGSATALFEGLQVGARLQASGPYGRFCLPAGDDNRRYLLVATGTGVTPYRSMLPQLAAAIAERDVQVVLVQGARGPGELLYGEEFAAFAATQPGFSYVPCFSREPGGAAYPQQRHGYVQQHLAELVLDAHGDIAYLCGNPDMVDAGVALLKQAGFGNARIRREKYVSSGS